MEAPHYQSTRPLIGKLYVCEAGASPMASRVAGPFDTAAEAYAAAGAIEADFPFLQARTEVWRACPLPEFGAVPLCLPPPTPASFYGQNLGS